MYEYHVKEGCSVEEINELAEFGWRMVGQTSVTTAGGASSSTEYSFERKISDVTDEIREAEAKYYLQQHEVALERTIDRKTRREIISYINSQKQPGEVLLEENEKLTFEEVSIRIFWVLLAIFLILLTLILFFDLDSFF